MVFWKKGSKKKKKKKKLEASGNVG